MKNDWIVLVKRSLVWTNSVWSIQFAQYEMSKREYISISATDTQKQMYLLWSSAQEPEVTWVERTTTVISQSYRQCLWGKQKAQIYHLMHKEYTIQ